MKNIKFIVLGFLFCLTTQAIVVRAGDITANGWFQKDIVTFLGNVVTMGNEIKSDHNVAFASYTGLRRQIISFNNYSAARNAIRSRSISSTTVATTTDLTLSGL